MRTALGMIGIGLLVLGTVGLVAHLPVWLVALDYLGAVMAIGSWFMPGSRLLRALPLALGGALFIVALTALATGSAADQIAWLTLGVGVALALMGVAGSVDRELGHDLEDPHRPIDRLFHRRGSPSRRR